MASTAAPSAPFLVAPAHPAGRRQGGRFGDPDELEGEVAIGDLLVASWRGRVVPAILEPMTRQGRVARRRSTQSPTRDADFETMSGVPVEPVYGPDDGEFPGQYPYTRGPYASMYRSKLWTMRMFAGFGTADDTNQRFHEILAAGRRRACRPRSTCRR